MDADSSYGGSDTAQDSTSANENTSSIETTVPNDGNHEEISTVYLNVQPSEDANQFYHKNEVTLPINYDETDAEATANLPHYMSTANLKIDDSPAAQNNLEQMGSAFKSTTKLHQPTPKTRRKSPAGVDNPAFQDDSKSNNGVIRSSFGENKKVNGDLNAFGDATKQDEPMTEAVNLELINMKPTGKDVTGPYDTNAKNGLGNIPTKKDAEVEMNNPYDEYFVPVNEHRKYMR